MRRGESASAMGAEPTMAGVRAATGVPAEAPRAVARRTAGPGSTETKGVVDRPLARPGPEAAPVAARRSQLGTVIEPAAGGDAEESIFASVQLTKDDSPSTRNEQDH